MFYLRIFGKLINNVASHFPSRSLADILELTLLVLLDARSRANIDLNAHNVATTAVISFLRQANRAVTAA